MHFFARIRRNLDTNADAPAINTDGRWHSRREVAAMADTLTSLLDQAGLGAGVRIGLVARNRVPHVAALYGLLASARTTVMIYAAMTPDALAKEIVKLRLPAVIADAEDWTDVTLAAAKQTNTMAICIFHAPSLPFDVAMPIARPEAGSAGEPEIAIEMLSSGTTGPPKRIPISWQTLEAMARDAAVNFAESGQVMVDGQIAPLIQPAPLANIGGLYAVIPAGVEGWRLALVEKFDVTTWLAAVKRVRPRVSWLAPAAIRALWDADVSREELASLIAIRTGSAPLDPGLKDDFERKYGIAILLAYGATEFCGVVALWSLADHAHFGATKKGSSGRARPGVALRVRDAETNELLAAGEPGILELKVDRIGQDWIVTTDLAKIDRDGFVYLLGRADDAINRGGFKIVPTTILDVLSLHPAVADAAVVALPDARLGEVPAVVVVVREGFSVDQDILRAFLRERLLAYQIPVHFRFVGQLPRNASLKVDRGAVRALFNEDAKS